jgi:Septum formation
LLIVLGSVLGVIVVGLVVGGVLAVLSGDDDDVSAFDLSVGDCFDLPNPNGQITEVGGVPCSDPHDAEVYDTFDIEAAEFPGQNAVVREAQRGCKQSFADFVGLTYQKSELELQSLYPTEQSWDIQDDREVVCAVTEPKGQKTTVETLEDANR